MGRQTLGREAIDAIKEAYRDGRTFSRSTEVRQFVIDRLGVKPKKVRITAAGNWDRQARLELAELERVSVTSPTGGNDYLRNPNAKPGERIISRHVRRKDTATRAENDWFEARADASQPDASEVERLKAALSEIAATAARRLVESEGRGQA